MDIHVERLADLLVDYSCAVKNNENVLIEATGFRTIPLVKKLVEKVYKAGGNPFVRINDEGVVRQLLLGAKQEQYETLAAVDRALMEKMQCYIGVRGSENALENSDVPPASMKIFSSTILNKVHFEVRVPKTRWVVLRYPNPSFAQAAKMSNEAFEEFYFKACIVDYEKMSKAMDPLVALMNRTDKVHIKGPGTDLRFSIKNIPAIKCDGKLNIPDGEVFTAPVKHSVQGTLQYNTPTLYEGNVYDGVRLVFKDGKIVEATCAVGDPKRLNDILDRDDGARYVGEFALGCNPIIREPMLDILFDEKIAGSFHFTPGASYDEAPNDNKSQVHWDMVCRQFAEHGGGEIWFDDVLIRKDGMFVLDELKALNP